MKIIGVFCLVGAVLCHFSSYAREVVTYEDLGLTGYPRGLSADGSVVVTWDFGKPAVRWENGESVELGMEVISDWGDAISDDGSIIIGHINWEVSVWTDGEITPLGFIGGPRSISGDGSVIYGSRWIGDERHLWKFENGELMDMPDQVTNVGPCCCDGSQILTAGETGIYVNNILLPLSLTDLSSDGSVMVGTRWLSEMGPMIPYIKINGVELDLGLCPDLPEEADWSMGHALRISDDGKVVLGIQDYGTGFGNSIISEWILWKESDAWQPIQLNRLLESAGIALGQDDQITHINGDGSVLIGWNSATKSVFRIRFLNMFGQFLANNGIAETEEWMGRLHVNLDPWVWCEKVPCWLNVPESTANAARGWVYPTEIENLQIIKVPGTDWGYSFAMEKWLYRSASGWMFMM